MKEIQVISTADGSHSLLNTRLQETYHSVQGAVQESIHVYLKEGLENWHQQHHANELSILEVGFGTGLNALLTLLYANKNGCKVYYESWEASPLDPVIVQQLNYGEFTGAGKLFDRLHDAPWEVEVPISSGFILRKHCGDVVLDSFPNTTFDVIYFDAFAPSKQPEMWSPEVLRKVTGMLNPGGIWVSYCAKGQVKRDLASLGLAVEALPGPPGKKEMTRAKRIRS